MRIHLKYSNSNQRHTDVTWFINAANCGTLCMLTDDLVTLQLVLSRGLSLPQDGFVSSGHVYDPEEDNANVR